MFVVYTNTPSIGNKWTELALRTGRADAIATAETWLQPGGRDDGAVPPGFCSFRCDGGR